MAQTGEAIKQLGPSEVASRVNGYLSVAWQQEVSACCCIVINRELLFFHLGMITQGSRPDTDEPRSGRLMDEDEPERRQGVEDVHGYGSKK